MATLRPPDRLGVEEWAQRYRHLSRETSPAPGPWRIDRTPYLSGILEAVSDPSVRVVVLQLCAQSGKTESVIGNLIGYHIDHDPAPMLVVLPRDRDAEKWSKSRLAPMVRDTPRLQGQLGDVKSRTSGNTILEKTGPRGVRIVVAAAGSPSGLAGDPIRVFIGDELDRWVASAGAEGDPYKLAEARTTAFWNRKILVCSTPTIRGASRIEDLFQGSDRRELYVPCPDCGHHQVLTWAGVDWSDPDGRPDGWIGPRTEDAAYRCEECRSLWNDARRRRALRDAEWRAGADFKGIAGFKLPAMSTLWENVSLPNLARRFEEEHRDPLQFRVFVNTVLAETWEDKGATVDPTGLVERCEVYPAQVPERGLIVTWGADVQDDRIEIEFVAWGIGYESWSIGYEVVWGDVSLEDVWEEALDRVVTRSFQHESGAEVYARAGCLDTGSFTQTAYQQAASRFKRLTPTGESTYLFPVKGVGGAGLVWPQSPTIRRTKATKGRKPPAGPPLSDPRGRREIGRLFPPLHRHPASGDPLLSLSGRPPDLLFRGPSLGAGRHQAARRRPRPRIRAQAGRPPKRALGLSGLRLRGSPRGHDGPRGQVADRGGADRSGGGAPAAGGDGPAARARRLEGVPRAAARGTLPGCEARPLSGGSPTWQRWPISRPS